MKYTTPLIAALSGLALLSTAPSTTHAMTPDDHSKDHSDDHSDDHSKDVQKTTLADFFPSLKKPDLWIGSDAPKLTIAEFIKGDPVTIEKGQVYVIEFWATWCGPCVAAFPHLSDLQAEYGNKVTFIGVNIWERVDQDKRAEFVKNFVADQGDRMSYTVALEEGTSMSDNWMRPAQQNSIPAAFIIDADSKIAWFGHPGRMDEPLKTIALGDFDSVAAGNKAWEDHLLMNAFRFFAASIQNGDDLDDARAIRDILLNNQFKEDPGGINAVAWTILSSEADDVGMADYKIAAKAIAKACELTNWENWSILDTYALSLHKTGDSKSAVKWQKKVIELAKAEGNADHALLAELGERLSIYENE